jgi:hypothetical protein
MEEEPVNGLSQLPSPEEAWDRPDGYKQCNSRHPPESMVNPSMEMMVWLSVASECFVARMCRSMNRKWLE